MSVNTTMATFTIGQTKDLLRDLDLRTKKLDNKEYVLDEHNDISACPVCKTQITVDKVGSIAKGSRIVFCDNPACFATHLGKQER